MTFEFDGKWFLQNSGTTMGTTKWSPHYADIYRAYFEEKAIFWVFVDGSVQKVYGMFMDGGFESDGWLVGIQNIDKF